MACLSTRLLSLTLGRTYAWGHDSLLVNSHSYQDDRNGWGATVVDAMDTMVYAYVQISEYVTETPSVDYGS